MGGWRIREYRFTSISAWHGVVVILTVESRHCVEVTICSDGRSSGDFDCSRQKLSSVLAWGSGDLVPLLSLSHNLISPQRAGGAMMAAVSARALVSSLKPTRFSTRGLA